MQKPIFFILTFLQLQCADELPSLAIRYAVATRQGKRNAMEDVHTIITNIESNSKNSFFGVYDGHSGTMAAQKAAERLCDLIIASEQQEPKRSIAAYEQVHNEIISSQDTSGTTAVTAYIEQKDNRPILNLAWAGDSRALLIDTDGNIIAATRDHKPHTQQEIDRIYAHGGRIRQETTMRDGRQQSIPLKEKPLSEDLPRFITFVDGYKQRFLYRTGTLSVSRSLGDKKDKNKKNQDGKPMSTIATPEVITIPLEPTAAGLILASDGFWDVISNETAAAALSSGRDDIIEDLNELLLNELKEFKPHDNEQHEAQGSDEKMIAIAKAMRESAYGYNSYDNISVLIAYFDWQSKSEDASKPSTSQCATTTHQANE